MASLALHGLLREPLQPGRVIAVLPSVIYLDFGEHGGEPRVIALTTPGAMCLPNAIALKLPSKDAPRFRGARTVEPAARRLLAAGRASGAELTWGLMAGCGAALALSVP